MKHSQLVYLLFGRKVHTFPSQFYTNSAFVRLKLISNEANTYSSGLSDLENVSC